MTPSKSQSAFCFSWPDARRGMSRYFSAIWRGIATTVGGMKLTFSYIFRRPVTMLYPEERPNIPQLHRGLHCYDIEKCNVCQGCTRICPVDAITIEYEGRGKKATISRYEIDYSKCLFCNLCCEVCPTHCVWMGEDWDLSAYDRDGCISRLHEANLETMQSRQWPVHKAEEEAKAAKKAAAARAKAEADKGDA